MLAWEYLNGVIVEVDYRRTKHIVKLVDGTIEELNLKDSVLP